MFGIGACGKVKERIVWLIMACIMESLWDVGGICVFKRRLVSENECIRMLLSKLYVYYL